MYLIRSFHSPPMLQVEMSGRVSTAEALRATSQAAALASADGARGILCDIRGVDEGPDTLLPVAAALATASSPARRLAFVTTANQLALIERLARVAGVRYTTGFFEESADGRAWILRSDRPVLSPADLYHAQHAQQTPRSQERRAARLATRISAA